VVSLNVTLVQATTLFFNKHGMLKSLLLLASYNNPSASAVATDIAVADVITAVP
jgi:hypothetical protein